MARLWWAPLRASIISFNFPSHSVPVWVSSTLAKLWGRKVTEKLLLSWVSTISTGARQWGILTTDFLELQLEAKMSISLTTLNTFVFIDFPVVTEHVKEPGKSFVSCLTRNQQSETSLCAEFSCEHSQSHHIWLNSHCHAARGNS